MASVLRQIAVVWACLAAVPSQGGESCNVRGIAAVLQRAAESLDWHYFWEDLDEREAYTELQRAEWLSHETVRKAAEPLCTADVDATLLKGRALDQLLEIARRHRLIYREGR